MDLFPPHEIAPAIAPAIAPEAVHPALWRANQVGRAGAAVFASGFDELDALLPGGGWPARALTELLFPHTGVGEMRLLAPALVRQQSRGLMWFDPPALPCADALRALGLELASLVLVQSRPLLGRSGSPSDALWALEHALKSGHVGAALAWLPVRLPADALRRLQLAAQGHEGPVFLLRHQEAAAHASPAPLRLLLSCAAPDWLRVSVIKRRGPPVAEPLLLALAPVLSAPAQARAEAGAASLPEGALGEDQWA